MNVLRITSTPDPSNAAITAPTPGSSPERERPATDSIVAWLAVLTSLMACSEVERARVRDELDDHLRQRVRDLMLAGEAEPAAVSTALGELGDAATLAAQWSNARQRPRRRLLMGFAAGLFGVSGIAIVAAIASGAGGGLAGRGEPPTGVGVSVFQPGPAAAPTPDGVALIDLRVSVEQDMTWSAFFEMVGATAKMPVAVHWSQIRGLQQGNDMIDESTPLGLSFNGLTLASALNMMNDSLNLPMDDGVQVRAIDGSLVFASASYFDRLETLMVTYDLSTVPDNDIGGEAGIQQCIVDAIQNMALPNLWRANDGDRASLQQIGRTLLIKAPRRVHTQVEWILRHGAGLGKQQEAAAVGGAPTRPAAVSVPVLRDIPLVGNLFKQAAMGLSDHEPGEATITLRHIDPAAFRTLLGAFFDVAKGMKECDFERMMEAKGTTFRIRASQRQATLASMVAFLVDRPANEAFMGPPETKRMRLTNTDPAAVAAWLNKAFDVSPYLHESPVPRSIAADVTDNSVIFGSTADQARTVESLVRLADDPVTWTQRAISEEAERQFGPPRVIVLNHGIAQTLAPVIASAMVGAAMQTRVQILVVAHESLNAVVVAGDHLLADRAERMARSLDHMIGLAGKPEMDLSVLRSFARPTQVEYLPDGVIPVQGTGLGR